MRNAFIKALCEEAKIDKRIMLLTGDLGFNVIEPFANLFPDRFINVGVSEANLITVSAGLAASGFLPFAYSIATFATMRAFEQIRSDISLQNVNVKIVGVGGGLAYAKAGPTHHSVEDIGLMRLLPNMTIVNPCDPDETYQATKALLKSPFPAYLRLEKNPEKNVHTSHTFILGKGEQLRSGKGIAIIATGTKSALALDVAYKLHSHAIFASVYAFPTIAPFDYPLLMDIAKNHTLIFTLEEHRRNGGLGTAVLECLSGKDIINTKVFRFGLRDGFTPISASYEKMMAYHGLTAEQLFEAIRKISSAQ